METTCDHATCLLNRYLEGNMPADNPTPDGAATAYAAGDLDGLIALMTDAQQLQFKMAVVRQAIACLEAILPPKEADDGERSAIYPARQWLDDPTEDSATEVAIFITMEYADGGLRYSD